MKNRNRSHQVNTIDLECGNPFLIEPFMPGSDQSTDPTLPQGTKSHPNDELQLKSHMLDLNSNAIFLNDLSGKFVYVNNACTDLTGYTRDDLLEPNANRLKTPGYLLSATAHYKELMETGMTTFEAPGLRKDGSSYIMEVTCKIINIGNKKYVLNTVRDITTQKEARDELKRSNEKLQHTLDGFIDTIAMLSEIRDPYTASHERHVSRLSHAIAGEMQLDINICESIRVAGTLHDIGKLSIPAEILSKPGRLTPAEFAIIKRHPEIGRDILKPINFPWPICDIISQHHERLDGTGYPQGLDGNNICLEARILAVADVVEAMASHRPYRSALGIDAALDEVVKNSGVKYDTDAVNACVRLINEKDFSLD